MVQSEGVADDVEVVRLLVVPPTGGYLYSGISSPAGTVTLLVKVKVADPEISALYLPPAVYRG
jgi:hypothetical protein